MKKLLPLLLAFSEKNAVRSWSLNVNLSRPHANPSALRTPTALVKENLRAVGRCQYEVMKCRFVHFSIAYWKPPFFRVAV